MADEFSHEPVLRDEVVSLLQPQPGKVYCDATTGGGGHAEAILRASSPDGRLIGIDRDLAAVEAARKRLAPFGDRVQIFHARFSQIEEVLARAQVRKVDGLLLDLGVSSHQIDVAMRGFSFMNPGPLDMRMDTTSGETAQQLLARLSEDEITDILYRFGEERYARRIARAIKDMEAAGRLNSTADLAMAVSKVVRTSRDKHPATRVFQAIRIAVNDELGELQHILDLLPEPLAVGGTVVIITFHSLEDRMVKQRFAELTASCTCPPRMPVCRCPEPVAAYVSRRKVRVSAAEKTRNRRARSATARAIRRIR